MKTFLIILIFYTTLFGNALKYETSPYLQAHKNNPVDWMPWGEAAFAKAKREHKSLFVSIGYSTCHWCHVMEEESFTDKKLAVLFNKYFVSVKVDREELPQVDELYQRVFKQAHNRSGGWPLSVFMTPEKKVFYIAGYLPPHKRSYSDGLYKLLPYLGNIAQNDTKALSKMIEQMKHPLQKAKRQTPKKLSIHTLKSSLLKEYDDIYGGFGSGRKFPQVSKLNLLLDIAQLQDDNELAKNVYETLDAMATHGLYDQVEGGFFRYSVDAAWEIPHFEKMLYTQAELISLYTRAYHLTHKPLYKAVVQESIQNIKHHFTHKNLYWSASDADSFGGEGAYYTFTPKELAGTGFDKESNFDGRIHLNVYDTKRFKSFLQDRKKLLALRAKCQYPFIDKKINTAWNALLIESLYKASSLNKSYKSMADNSLKALSDTMFEKGELFHQTIAGKKPTQKGILEDYSFFIGMLLSAYEVEYKEEYLNFAEYLLMKAKELFYRDGVWYLSADGLKVAADLNDKYYISPLAKMTQNILALASLKASFSYETLANTTLSAQRENMQNAQADAPAMASAFLMQGYPIVTLKSSKEKLQKSKKEVLQSSYPYILTEEKPFTEYLGCTLRRCFVKETNLTKVLKVIDSKSFR